MKERVVNYKNIRREAAPYLWIWAVYYAWVILFTTWWTGSTAPDSLATTPLRANVHSVNLIVSALLVLLMKREWFVYTARIGGALLPMVATVYLFVPLPEALQPVLVLLLGIGMGLVNSAMLIPFVFVLNNTEKFYGVVISNMLVSLLVLTQTVSGLSITGNRWFGITMLLMGLAAIPFFRRQDLQKAEPPDKSLIPTTKKVVYLTLLLNLLYAIFCKGIGKVFLTVADGQTALSLEPSYYAGAVLGCVLYAALYAFLKNSNQATWSVTFASFIVAMLLYTTLDEGTGLYSLFATLLGIGGAMGMINLYYIQGVIAKKYWSMGYLRRSVVFIGVGGGITGLLLADWATASPVTISILVAVVAAGAFLFFLAMNPVLSASYFSDKWSPDSEIPEVDNDCFAYLKPYGLTQRETEVCVLLLDGYTLRQAGAILGLAYPTVNTHCTALYRKLSVNSRLELARKLKQYIVQ